MYLWIWGRSRTMLEDARVTWWFICHLCVSTKPRRATETEREKDREEKRQRWRRKNFVHNCEFAGILFLCEARAEWFFFFFFDVSHAHERGRNWNSHLTKKCSLEHGISSERERETEKNRIDKTKYDYTMKVYLYIHPNCAAQDEGEIRTLGERKLNYSKFPCYPETKFPDPNITFSFCMDATTYIPIYVLWLSRNWIKSWGNSKGSPQGRADFAQSLLRSIGHCSTVMLFSGM